MRQSECNEIVLLMSAGTRATKSVISKFTYTNTVCFIALKNCKHSVSGDVTFASKNMKWGKESGWTGMREKNDK